jgi:hypothetical protein
LLAIRRLAGISEARQKVMGWLETVGSCYDEQFASQLKVWQGADTTFFSKECEKARSMMAACDLVFEEFDQFNENLLLEGSSIPEAVIADAVMKAHAEELDDISGTLVTMFPSYVAKATRAVVRHSCVTLEAKLPATTPEVSCCLWCHSVLFS